MKDSGAAIILIAAFALVAVEARAEILEVPTVFPTPAAAIAASTDGDTVLLRAGIYAAPISLPNWTLTLAGEYLLTRDTLDIASTVIGPDSTLNPEVRCIEAVGPGTLSRLIGLKLVGGSVQSISSYGGGVFAQLRTLEIDHCRITKCAAWIGGALAAVDCSVRVSHSKLDHNRSVLRNSNIMYLQRTTLTAKNSVLGYTVLPAPEHSDREIYFAHSSIFMEACRLSNMGWLTRYGTSFFETERNAPAIRVELNGCHITNCRINHLFQISDNSGVRFFAMDSCLVEVNEVAQGLYGSTNGDSTYESRFVGNVFQNNTYPDRWVGLGLLNLQHRSRPTEVHGNLFLHNSTGEWSCISAWRTDTARRDISRNYFFENTHRTLLFEPGGDNCFSELGDSVFHHNILAGNVGNAAWAYPNQIPSHCEHNYWNSPLGPYQSETNPTSDGDSVSANIIYDFFEPDTSFLAIEGSDNRYLSGAPDFLVGFAYPNPFNSEITINYALTKDANTRLTIYNLQGQEVTTLVNSPQRIGVHEVTWNAMFIASGIYFAALSTDESSQRPNLQKLVLLK